MSQTQERVTEVNRDARLLFYAAQVTHLSWHQLTPAARVTWRARAAAAREVMAANAKADMGLVHG